MDIALKKVELIEWLIQLKDEQVLDKIEKFKKQSVKEDYESRLKPMTAKAYKAMLDQSKDDYKHGRVISQEKLEKESETW